jgi:hypothetical protein
MCIHFLPRLFFIDCIICLPFCHGFSSLIALCVYLFATEARNRRVLAAKDDGIVAPFLGVRRVLI